MIKTAENLPNSSYERKILCLLRGGKGADKYALYNQIKNAKFEELNKAILRLKSKKFIHVTGHRMNTRTGMMIPIYSLSPNKASFDSKIERMIFEEMVGSFSYERSIEYAFVARNFSTTTRGMRILDVGSERSELTRIISIIGWEQRWEVYGIDFSKFEQIVNKKSLSLLVRMDARQMGFRDNIFDRILCISMLEHIQVQILDQSIDTIDSRGDIKAITEIFRILRKGGSVILTVPYTDGKVECYGRACRIYNPQTIFELERGFKVKKEEFYIYVNGMWRNCKRTHLTKQLRLHGREAVPIRIESRVLLCLLLEK